LDQYKEKDFLVKIILWSFPFLLYFGVAALQYKVGTDYLSYVYIYNNQPETLIKYYEGGEYSFYYLNKMLSWFNAPAQSIFVVFSFIQSFFIFLFFSKMKVRGYQIYFIFYVFFTVTNIYNNQLNVIRQYAALSMLPLITYYCYQNKNIKALCLIFFASTFHSSAFLFFLVYIFKYINTKIDSKMHFWFFVISLPVYILFGKNAGYFVSLLAGGYSSYLGTSFFSGQENVIFMITKVYYIPLFFLYFYIFHRNEKYNHCEGDGYFKYCMTIFSLTYWSFVLILFAGIFSRISDYFKFFYIFPIYYLSVYFYSRKKIMYLMFVLIYIAFPYFLKVTFFANAEFSYRSYIFN